MRIAGYISHPVMKITILHMNNRYAVKFEKDGLEQTYKIRPSLKLDSVMDIKAFFNKEKMSEIEAIFSPMMNILSLSKDDVDEEDTFEEII